MTQLPILVPASRLTKSPTNVRKSSDAAADAQLQANIAERGQAQLRFENHGATVAAKARGLGVVIAGGCK